TKLFDAFVAHTDAFGNGVYRDFDIAMLLYRHPGGCRSQAGYALFRQIEKNPQHELRSIQDYRGDRAQEKVFRFAQDIAAQLKQLGRSKDAQWLQQFAAETWPLLWRPEFRKDSRDALPASITSAKRVSMPTFASSGKTNLKKDFGW
ncbi:hypothetical protein LTR17_023631, partial [Elasticomyces elasticus]